MIEKKDENPPYFFYFFFSKSISGKEGIPVEIYGFSGNLRCAAASCFRVQQSSRRISDQLVCFCRITGFHQFRNLDFVRRCTKWRVSLFRSNRFSAGRHDGVGAVERRHGPCPDEQFRNGRKLVSKRQYHFFDRQQWRPCTADRRRPNPSDGLGGNGFDF